MKKDGKYRFSLQFGTDSEEQIRAGELLERLGNKKSQIIVAALNEYMGVHPELLIKNCKTELKLTSEYDAVKLKQMVKEIIENKLMEIEKSTTNGDATLEPISTSDDIEQMLGNLELFK